MTKIANPAPATPAAEVQQVKDAGALRLGGLSPMFEAAQIADAGKLRLGGLSPLFG